MNQAPPSAPSRPTRSSPASRKPVPPAPFKPARHTTLPTSPLWTDKLLSQIEDSLSSWTPEDYGRAAAYALQHLGILDPVAWAGTTQSLGDHIFSLLFPEPNLIKGVPTRSALAPRYTAVIRELSSVNPLDVGHACHIVCFFAVTDLLHTLTPSK